MRILEIAGDSPTFNGGIAANLRLLQTGLPSLGHSVSFLHPTFRVGEFKFSGIPFRRFSEYDVVHIHGPTPFLSDLITLNRSARTMVLTYHADVEWISPLLSRAYRQVHLMLHQRTRAIVVQGVDYLQRVGRFHSNVRVIRPPAPLWRGDVSTLDLKPDRFTVLFVGQFRPFKGLDVLLEVTRSLPSIQFTIAGSGYLESWLRKATIGLRNVELRVNPTREELKALYTNSHVTCLPSTNSTEAYGLTLVEGALLGALPIASALPGVSENVHTLGGILFQPGDAVSLARRIRSLKESRETWRESARQSMVCATQYAEENAPPKWLKAYNNLFLDLSRQDL